jgi:hypothetical protein
MLSVEVERDLAEEEKVPRGELMASNFRKFKNPEPVVPGRKVDMQLGGTGQNPALKRIYQLLRELENVKSEIGDVDVTTVPATVNDILVFNGVAWTPVDKTALLALTHLTDVVLVSPATNDLLRFNGTDWVNSPLSNLIALNDLSDVTISAVADGDLLVYNSGSGQWGNRPWTPATFGVGAAATRGKFEITVSDVTTFFSENQEATTTTQGWRIDRTSAANTKPQGIVWRSENSPRWELTMDGSSKNLGIYDHSANGGAGAYVMRISREADASGDLNSPKVFFGRNADNAADENVFFSIIGGDDTDSLQGVRISHYGDVNSNALGLVNRNASIKTCRFNFNTLWLMGTDILGTNATDFWFYDNVNNLGRIFVKAESNPLPKIGIGSANPQAALSVLLDISAAANTIQRSFHAQIANDPSNRGVNIETIRESGVAVWNYIWLEAGLGAGSTVGTRVSTSSGARSWGWEGGDNQLAMVTGPTGTNQTLSRPFIVDFSGSLRLGFFNVTPQARTTAYTQTFSTTARTVPAYTTDAESGAYTGIDNAQAGTVYAQVTDLNALRTAYENIRASYDETVKVLNSVIDDLQGYGLFQ